MNKIIQEKKLKPVLYLSAAINYILKIKIAILQFDQI